MRTILKILGLTFAIVIAAIAALAIYAQNANHLKPELQALIADRTGIDVTLGGELSWQLWPPIQLAAADITAIDGDRTITAETLTLALDLSSFWQDMETWRVDAFHLTNTTLTDAEQKLTVSQLDLTDFELGQPSSLAMQGTVQGNPTAAIYPFSIDGTLTYTPESNQNSQQIRLSETALTSTGVSGTCDLDIRNNPRVPNQFPAQLLATSDSDLLPLETLLTYELLADCLWHEVTLDEQTFTNIETKITNVDESLNVFIEAPEFFAGSMITEIDVDLTAQPMRWRLMPELTDVDSKRLLEWRSRSLNWTALFATHSDATFTGNSTDALYNSISADSRLDGQPGQIDITELKKQLANVALLTRQGESVADWPDVWQYQEMIGNLQTRGTNQTFDFVLDHLLIEGTGTVDYAAQTMDMLANITIGAAPEGSPYRVNPILQDTPLPFRCRGPTAEVKCKLDEGATKSLIGRALRVDDDSGLRRKIEQKIEEEVPEEYREAAKGLLDILGRALEEKD